MNKFLLVAFGGAVGSVLRFWLGGYVDHRMESRFPYGTFVINITASFLIGFLLTILGAKADWSPNWRYLFSVGFLGGYSTFSTFEYETFRILEDGHLLMAGLNTVLSVVVGLVSVWLGYIAAKLAI